MQSKLTMVVLFGFILMGAAACGGGGDSGKISDLEARIEEAEEARKAAEEAAAEEKKKREDAEEKADDVEEAEKRAEEAEKKAEEAERRRQEAERRAREQEERQAQTLEANQRAQGLLDALGRVPEATALTSFAAPPEAAVSVKSKNKLTFGTKSSTTKSGFRYAKVTDTFGRTRTTMGYTDRELSRKLLDHYGAHLQGTTQIKVVEAAIDITNLVATNSPASLTSRVPPKKEPTDGYTSPAKLTSLSGKLHGQSGTFRCTGEDCLITLTATYTDHDSDSETADELTGLTMAVTAPALLVFEPGGASVSLCEDMPASCVFDDTEYMVFGYWIEDPESATGTYVVQPFAEVEEGSALKTFPTTGTARYKGAAVGVYVESAPFGSTEIDKRQGDFEASVSLNANFASGGSGVSGWISGFKTTPRGGSAAPRTSNWRVTLGSGTTAATVTGSATIDGLESTGNWAAQFVRAREDAASDKPSAVVGVFDTSGQSLHVTGAFGARRQ